MDQHKADIHVQMDKQKADIRVQIDQYKTDMSIRIWALYFLSILFNQLPNILAILVDEVILYAKKTIRHIIWANVHDKNKCSTVFIESAKQHF
jgi:hypothetical protein